MERHATFSEDRKHRLSLYRRWDNSKPIILFIGINPSTADEQKDDATIRRLIRAATDWGYGGFFICNLFTYIATNPSMLWVYPHSKQHPHANMVMEKIRRACDKVIFMWGDTDSPSYLRQYELKNKFRKNIYCFKVTKKGNPGHPLYLPNGIQPIRYNSLTIYESTKNN